MRATMDLISLYQVDNTILDLMQLPQDVDRETVRDNLLMETAELELLYPNPVFLKMAIGTWSKKQLPVWEELIATTQYEYNPIWNKDGTIHELITRDLAATEDVSDDNTRTDNLTDLQTRDATDTRTDNLTDLQTRNATDTRTDNLTDLTTNNLTDEQTRDLAGTSDSTTTRNVYGFNSSTGEPSEQTIQDVDTTDTGTITDEHTGTQTETHTGTQTDAHTGTITDAHTGTQTDTHTGTITDSHTGTQTDNRTIDRDTTDTGTIDTFRTEQGNIGTTSTQSLILEQRDVVKFNIIDYIIGEFKDRFCLRLY